MSVPRDTEQAAPLLRVTGLRTSFATPAGMVRAVDGVDLDIPIGTTLCMVGESGSGKSVAARSILRLVDPPGRIEPGSQVMFEGRDLATIGEAEMRQLRGRAVSMVFQEPMSSLNPVATVGQQIAETLRIHRMADGAEAWRRAVEMMAFVGIPSPAARAHDYPHQMSGGMLQRVMIAMALVCRPKLLIADEPTTALDVTVQAQILDLMRRLRDEFGMAMLMITHDLGVAAEMADTVAVMYAGQIVESGAAATVFGQPEHPYTAALLRSVPRLGMTQDEPLPVIPGMVPSALDWPDGCRFADRCAHVFERCRREAPPLFDLGGHAARCWLSEAGPRPRGGM